MWPSGFRKAWLFRGAGIVVGGLLLLARAQVVDGHDDDDADRHDDKLVSHVEISVKGEYRYIDSNGLPDHEHGDFPNRGNPNTIAAQSDHYRVPLHPEAGKRLTPLEHRCFGIAINGVVFDPGTAEFWNDDPRSGWNYEAFTGPRNLGIDQSLAHVQPGGVYHYHGIPIKLIEKLIHEEGEKDGKDDHDGEKKNAESPAKSGKNAKDEHDHKRLAGPVQTRMILVGWAADGYPIYGPYAYTDPQNPKSELKKMSASYRIKDDTRPEGKNQPGGKYDGSFTEDWEYEFGKDDLDECNGREGVTPEFPDGTYYYVLTEDFPYVPRLWHGTPDPSFNKKRPPGGGPGGRGGSGPGGRGGPDGHDRPPPPDGGDRGGQPPP